MFAFLAVLAAMPAWSREVTLELDGTLYSFDPSRDLGRQNEVFEAVQLLPADQDEAVIATLLRNSSDVIPPFLYELARRLWSRDRDRAFEWYAVAFIRSHYDAYRCLDRSAGQGLMSMHAIAENVTAHLQSEAPTYGRNGLRAFARADVFAGTASPRWICVHGAGAYAAALEGRNQPDSEWLRPENEWAAFRQRLRDEGTRAYQRMVNRQ